MSVSSGMSRPDPADLCLRRSARGLRMKKQRRARTHQNAGIVVSLLALGLGVLPAVGTAQTSELSAQLDSLLRSYESQGFSGTVLVSVDGKVILERGYGMADRARGISVTPRTLFDFASLAKTFTGAAVLRLEADGILQTSDRLEAYLGAFPLAKSAATIHHLATHRAGLAHRTESFIDGDTRERFISSMKKAPIESSPGAAYRYSNAGTSLLAAVVEIASGVSYETYVRTHFFRPLNLENTGFLGDFTANDGRLARGYRDEGDEPAPPAYGWTWQTKGAGGLISTVGDIHRWYGALRSGALLPPAQQRKLFDPTETEAYGWHVDTTATGRRRIHKGGGLVYMQSQVLAYPDVGYVIVWAHNNMERNWRRPLNDGISAILLGEEPND